MATIAATPVRLVLDSRSGEFRRRVGANAWVVLEELLLGASPGPAGRVVSRATVRALAERTGLSKDTVARSLLRLRKADAFTVEPERHDDSGRFVSVLYLVDLNTLPVELVSGATDAPTTTQRPQQVGRPEQLSMLG